MATHWMMRAVVIFTCMAMVFFATVTAFSYIAVYAKFRKLTHQLNKQTRETVVTAAPVTTQHVPEPKSTIGWHRSKENLTRCGSLGDVTKRINNHRETQAKERLILTKFIVLVVAFLSTFVFWLFSVVVYEAVTGRESPHVLTGMGAVLAYVDSSFNPIFILHQDTRFRAAVSRLWQKISPER
ncbi:hypothetical protein BC832DRAFT_190772 [Gaertneriomyces semiglobifer]|nr:hypothetical protein BC832DRAFT_190772 [Gaertneriomyces semiglobifer]